MCGVAYGDEQPHNLLMWPDAFFFANSKVYDDLGLSPLIFAEHFLLEGMRVGNNLVKTL